MFVYNFELVYLCERLPTLHSNKISAQWRIAGGYVRLFNVGPCFATIKMCSRQIMGRVMRNPVYCICENKYADKLRGVRAAFRCLRFHSLDRKKLSTLKIRNFKLLAILLYGTVCVAPGRNTDLHI